MTFREALRSTFGQFTNFNGRARRSDYFWFIALELMLWFAAWVIDMATNSPWPFRVVIVGLALPGLAMVSRRLHDTGRSGWWYLISFIPLAGPWILFYLCAKDTYPDTNQYGPPAKNVTVLPY